MTSEPHMNDKNALNDLVRQNAITWLLRQRDEDMTDQDWADFTTWLEQDPLHVTYYDEAVEADADLAILGAKIAETRPDHGDDDSDDSVVSIPVAANSNQPWWIGFGALAAMLLAAVVFWPNSGAPEFANLQTGLGEIREVTINSSVSLTMNGNSELSVNEKDATVRMVRGEATYRVDSDEPGALRVEIEELVLVDYGTVFNVIRGEGTMRMAVVEGAVMINPEGQRILISAGNEIELQLDDMSFSQRTIDGDSVLAWQDRRLVFEDRSVASVIADIERNFATHISVSNAIEQQRVTGAVSLANEEAIVIGDVAAVLGGTAQKDAQGWSISD